MKSYVSLRALILRNEMNLLISSNEKKHSDSTVPFFANHLIESECT